MPKQNKIDAVAEITADLKAPMSTTSSTTGV